MLNIINVVIGGQVVINGCLATAHLRDTGLLAFQPCQAYRKYVSFKFMYILGNFSKYKSLNHYFLVY